MTLIKIIMAKVILIGGEPATGKTSIMREVKSGFGTCVNFKYGLVRGENTNGIYFIGVFDGDKFEGTDKLSMAVQGDFIDFVKNYLREDDVVILEGDRLFTKSLIEELKPEIIIIECDDDVLEKRHKIRKDSQSETFLTGRRTKINNIKQAYKHRILNNNNEDDFWVCINEIKHTLDDFARTRRVP
jgi:uridine kinase